MKNTKNIMRVIVFVLMISFFLMGCGTNDQNVNEGILLENNEEYMLNERKDDIKISNNETEIEVNTEIGDEREVEEVEEVEDKTTLPISDAMFHEDFLYATVKVPNTNKEIYYQCNLIDGRVQKISDCYNNVVTYSENRSGDIYYDNWDRSFINIMTGECVYELDENEFVFSSNQFTNSVWLGDKALIGRIENAFSGNIYSMGILKNDGEWERSFSSELNVVSDTFVQMCYDEKHTVIRPSIDSNIIAFWACHSTSEELVLYDVDKDVILGSINVIDENFDVNREFCYKDGYCYFQTYFGECVRYCFTDGTTNRFSTSSIMFENDNIVSIVKTSDILMIDVYDYEWNRVAQFDLTTYMPSCKVHWATAENIAFTVSKNGGDYYCLMNTASEFLFEPILYNGNCRDVIFDDNKVIFLTRFDGSDYENVFSYMYDTSTNQIIILGNEKYKVVDYNSKYNQFLVCTELCTEYGKIKGNYCLVNVDDLDTLIYPLEK